MGRIKNTVLWWLVCVCLFFGTCVHCYAEGTALEGAWRQDDVGWWYEYSDGSYPVAQWVFIDGIWYYFDENGYLLVDGMTPDGYAVDADGARVDASALAQQSGNSISSGNSRSAHDGAAQQFVGNAGQSFGSAFSGSVDDFTSLQNSSGNGVRATGVPGGTYYWTPGGSKYHSTRDCPTLGRSKNILSGSLSQAASSGHSQACKVCIK